MSIIISEITPEFPVYEEVWQLRYNVLRKPLGLALSREEVLQEAGQIHLAAFSGDALLGCVLLAPEKNEIRLRQMAVAEAFRGRGIGRQLLFAAENAARKRGQATIFCHARETAVGFYEGNGWVVQGSRFYEVTLPHFAMKKNLLPESAG